MWVLYLILAEITNIPLVSLNDGYTVIMIVNTLLAPNVQPQNNIVFLDLRWSWTSGAYFWGPFDFLSDGETLTIIGEPLYYMGFEIYGIL